MTFAPGTGARPAAGAVRISMSTDLPILYVKTACGWCNQASAFLSEHGIGYREVNVSKDAAAASTMQRISHQTRAPVLDWHGRILADFGLEELKPFLHSQQIPFEDS